MKVSLSSSVRLGLPSAGQTGNAAPRHDQAGIPNPSRVGGASSRAERSPCPAEGHRGEAGFPRSFSAFFPLSAEEVEMDSGSNLGRKQIHHHLVNQRQAKHRQAAEKRAAYWATKKDLKPVPPCDQVPMRGEAEVARAQERAAEHYLRRATDEAASRKLRLEKLENSVFR